MLRPKEMVVNANASQGLGEREAVRANDRGDQALSVYQASKTAGKPQLGGCRG
jgi:hypothetical protein